MQGDDLDDCLRLVADRHRRVLLQALRHDANGAMRIEDFVDRLHIGEPGNDLRSNRERLATRLYHAHIPKLADHGVVEYDLERGTIEYQPDEQLEAVLDSLPDEMSVASP